MHVLGASNTTEGVNSSFDDSNPGYNDLPIPGDVAVLGAVFGTLVVSLGTFGNILIIMSVFRVKSLRKASNMFVVSLALCDLFQTLMVKPLYIHTYMVGEWHFGNIACLYALFASNLTILESILHVMVIALYRYVIIVHPAKSRSFLRLRNMILVLFILYLLPFVVVLTPSLLKAQRENVTFNKRIMFCSFVKQQGSRLAGVLKKVVFLSVAAAFLLFCYVSIVQQVRKSRRSLRNQGRYNSSRIRREVMLLKTVITMFFSFVLTYLPISIIYTVDTERTFTYMIYFIGVSLLWTSSSANWIIYGCVNKQYFEAYRYILCKKEVKSFNQSNENSRELTRKFSPSGHLEGCPHHHHRHNGIKCRCSFTNDSSSIHQALNGTGGRDHPSIRISLQNFPFTESRHSNNSQASTNDVVCTLERRAPSVEDGEARGNRET